MDEPIHAQLDKIAKTMGFNNWDRLCLTADPYIISDCVEMAVNNWSLKKAKDDYDKRDEDTDPGY